MMIIKLKHRKSILFRLILLCNIVLIDSLKAQNAEAYNQIYTKTYLEISQKDFPKALQIADSLYNISETPRFKAKSLMLSASLFQQSGEFKDAIDYALKAEKIIDDTDDNVWKAKISGFLATQYRYLKLFDQSKKYIDETTKVIQKIDNPRLTNQTMGFLMQENAYYEIEHKKYRESIKSVNNAIKYFELSGQIDPFLSSNNEQLLGLNYYYLEDYSTSINYYQKALDKLNQMPDNFLKALVLNGIAQIYIAQKNPKKAKPFIDKAQYIAEESPYLSLKNEIYQSSQQYYTLTKNIEKLEQTKQKQDSVSERINNNASAFINDSYTKLNQTNVQIQEQSVVKNIIIMLVFFLLVIVVIFFLIYKKNQKQKIAKIQQILEDIEQKKLDFSETNSSNQLIQSEDEVVFFDQIDQDEIEPQVLMTPATEKKILSKLEKFEQTTLFTRNNVSLPYVAAYCSTNTKYLSYVVNNYKKKDFKNYINELRVKHIIKKLKNDSQYHKYKISSLAEEAGFSSQSKFAAAFRKVTTVSPSEFLEHLRSQHLN